MTWHGAMTTHHDFLNLGIVYLSPPEALGSYQLYLARSFDLYKHFDRIATATNHGIDAPVTVAGHEFTRGYWAGIIAIGFGIARVSGLVGTPFTTTIYHSSWMHPTMFARTWHGTKCMPMH